MGGQRRRIAQMRAAPRGCRHTTQEHHILQQAVLTGELAIIMIIILTLRPKHRSRAIILYLRGLDFDLNGSTTHICTTHNRSFAAKRM